MAAEGRGTSSLVLTVKETSKLLRLSKNATYEAIRRKQVPAIRIGGRLLVPRAALERLLAGDGRVVGNQAAPVTGSGQDA